MFKTMARLLDYNFSLFHILAILGFKLVLKQNQMG